MEDEAIPEPLKAKEGFGTPGLSNITGETETSGTPRTRGLLSARGSGGKDVCCLECPRGEEPEGKVSLQLQRINHKRPHRRDVSASPGT